MKGRDLKELHRLVQRYRVPAVLYALASIAREMSIQLRDLRDTSKVRESKRVYRRYANCWETAHKDLERLAARTGRVLNEGRED